MKIINDRTVWVQLLADLQTVVPDTTWFCSVEGIADIEADRKKEKEAASNKTGSAADSANSGGGFAGIFGGNNNQPAPPPGDPGMMDPGMMENQQAAPAQEINVLKLKGYSLILKQEILGDSLKENLKKSKLFKNNISENDVEIDLVMQEVDSNNIAAFTAYLKLNNPMRY